LSPGALAVDVAAADCDDYEKEFFGNFAAHSDVPGGQVGPAIQSDEEAQVQVGSWEVLGEGGKEFMGCIGDENASAGHDNSANDAIEIVGGNTDASGAGQDEPFAVQANVEPTDIELVVSQVQCSREMAWKALVASNNDIVNATMALSDHPGVEEAADVPVGCIGELSEREVSSLPTSVFNPAAPVFVPAAHGDASSCGAVHQPMEAQSEVEPVQHEQVEHRATGKLASGASPSSHPSVDPVELVGQMVCFRALRSAVALNGRVGYAASYDPAAGRFAVQLSDGTVRRVKVENIAWPATCPHCGAEVTSSQCFACDHGDKL